MENRDYLFYEQGVPELQDYLLSNELYWNLTGQDRLTIGGLLLARLKMEHVIFPGAEWDTIRNLDDQLGEIKEHWMIAWNNKVKREIGSRLRLWSEFLSDYWSSPDEFADGYTQEVKKRVILKLLEIEIGGKFPEQEQLASLDSRLHTKLIPGRFIWPDDQVENFNETEYWFLYGSLKTK